LFGPGSTVWKIGRERVLLAAGPAALLLQLAHPLVAAAVAEHSRFTSDPFERLRATLDAVLTISFGDRLQAEAAATRVRAVHSRVRGRLDTAAGRYEPGTPYRADDPVLALWVHATLVWSALEGYATFVRPVSPAERSEYHEEGKRFATLFGVTADVMPATYADFVRYFEHTLATSLAVSQEAADLAAQVLAPPVPGSAVVLPVLRTVTAGLLPPQIRDGFGLAWTKPRRLAFQAMRRSIAAGVHASPPAARFWPHYRAGRSRARP